jgi:hypothetical protein
MTKIFWHRLVEITPEQVDALAAVDRLDVVVMMRLAVDGKASESMIIGSSRMTRSRNAPTDMQSFGRCTTVRALSGAELRSFLGMTLGSADCRPGAVTLISSHSRMSESHVLFYRWGSTS